MCSRLMLHATHSSLGLRLRSINGNFWSGRCTISPVKYLLNLSRHMFVCAIRRTNSLRSLLLLQESKRVLHCYTHSELSHLVRLLSSTVVRMEVRCCAEELS